MKGKSFLFYFMAQLKNIVHSEKKQKCSYFSDLIVCMYQLSTIKENLYEIELLQHLCMVVLS